MRKHLPHTLGEIYANMFRRIVSYLPQRIRDSSEDNDCLFYLPECLVHDSRIHDSYSCVLIQDSIMMSTGSNEFIRTQWPMNKKRPHMIHARSHSLIH